MQIASLTDHCCFTFPMSMFQFLDAFKLGSEFLLDKDNQKHALLPFSSFIVVQRFWVTGPLPGCTESPCPTTNQPLSLWNNPLSSPHMIQIYRRMMAQRQAKEMEKRRAAGIMKDAAAAASAAESWIDRQIIELSQCRADYITCSQSNWPSVSQSVRRQLHKHRPKAAADSAAPCRPNLDVTISI